MAEQSPSKNSDIPLVPGIPKLVVEAETLEAFGPPQFSKTSAIAESFEIPGQAKNPNEHEEEIPEVLVALGSHQIAEPVDLPEAGTRSQRLLYIAFASVVAVVVGVMQYRNVVDLAHYTSNLADHIFSRTTPPQKPAEMAPTPPPPSNAEKTPAPVANVPPPRQPAPAPLLGEPARYYIVQGFKPFAVERLGLVPEQEDIFKINDIEDFLLCGDKKHMQVGVRNLTGSLFWLVPVAADKLALDTVSKDYVTGEFRSSAHIVYQGGKPPVANPKGSVTGAEMGYGGWTGGVLAKVCDYVAANDEVSKLRTDGRSVSVTVPGVLGPLNVTGVSELPAGFKNMSYAKGMPYEKAEEILESPSAKLQQLRRRGQGPHN